jgi:hypothetical protein
VSHYAEYLEKANEMIGTRYGNKLASCHYGHSHVSKLEAAVCQLIHFREKAGELKLLQVQDHIALSAAKIGYIPDFKCEDALTKSPFWLEAKGFANDRWPILKKLWKAYGPGKLEVWGGTYLRPTLMETIIPEHMK